MQPWHYQPPVRTQTKRTPWAAGLSVNAGNMSFNVGVDSQKLIAAGVTASLGGITTALYYAKDQEPYPGGCADGWTVNNKRAKVAPGDSSASVVNWTNSACVKMVVANEGDEEYSNSTTGMRNQSGLGVSASFAASDDTKVTIAWQKESVLLSQVVRLVGTTQAKMLMQPKWKGHRFLNIMRILTQSGLVYNPI